MNKKLLIVDGPKTISHQIAFNLSEGGYQVVEASDGKNGLSVLKENLDGVAIIRDRNMPLMTGLERVTATSKDTDMSKFPVVMSTSGGGRDAIQEAEEARPKGRLVKAMKPDGLLSIFQTFHFDKTGNLINTEWLNYDAA